MQEKYVHACKKNCASLLSLPIGTMLPDVLAWVGASVRMSYDNSHCQVKNKD